MGLSKGQQCLERKRCLTEFLRLVSGIDGSIAKENACAIEHILDERIITGIRMFMDDSRIFVFNFRNHRCCSANPANGTILYGNSFLFCQGFKEST